MQDLQNIGHCLYQQATALIEMKMYSEALERLEEAIIVSEEMGLSDDISNCKVLMEEIYLQLKK